MKDKDLSALAKLPLIIEVLRSLSVKQEDQNNGYLLTIAADATAEVFEHFRSRILRTEETTIKKEPTWQTDYLN